MRAGRKAERRLISHLRIVYLTDEFPNSALAHDSTNVEEPYGDSAATVFEEDQEVFLGDEYFLRKGRIRT